MTAVIAAAPVRKSIHVKVPPTLAFEVFAARMGAWWPKSHSVSTSPQREVIIEPHPGGRWFERGEDGAECAWGRVLAWEPPSRLLLAWQLNADFRYDASLVTEVEVRFIPDGDGTRVELKHRNLERYGDRAEAMKATFESPGGWSGILDGYAAVAAA